MNQRRRRRKPEPEAVSTESLPGPPPAGSGGRRRRWSRKKRLVVGAVVVVCLVAVAGVAAWFVRERRHRDNVWRLHDLATAMLASDRFADAEATCRRILALRPHDRVARFNLGVALLALGREDEAWVAIEAVAAAEDDFDPAHMALARRAIEHGSGDEAITQLLNVIRFPPSSVEAHGLLAELFRARGQRARAMEHLAMVAQTRGAPVVARVRAYLDLASAHGVRALFHHNPGAEKARETEYHGRIRELAQKELARSPTHALPLRTALARVHLAAGRNEEALSEVTLALEVAGTPQAIAGLRVLRAQIYWASGSSEAAATELEEALASEEAAPAEVFLAAGEYYAANREPQRAVEILTRGVVGHPDHEVLGLLLARSLFRNGDTAAAQEQCRTLATALPESVLPWLLLGDLLRAGGDLPGAAKAYESALERDPESAVARLRAAGTSLSDSGRTAKDGAQALAEAERIAREILDDYPESPTALLALAKVLIAGREDRGERALEDAHAFLSRALDADPGSVEARTFLALANLLRGRPDEAVLQFDRVLRSLPTDRPDVRLLLARAQLLSGSPEAALREATRALESLPDDVGGLKTVVEANYATKHYDRALEALRTLERLEPTVLDHVLLQADALSRLGDVVGAEERFRRAESVAEGFEDQELKNSELMRIAQTKAAFYARAGNQDKALGAFDDLTSRDPDNVEWQVAHGRFLLGMGREEQAERQFQQAIARHPAQLAPRRALAEIYFGRGQVTPALRNQVEEVARQHPTAADVGYLRGKLALLAGDFKVAVSLLATYVEAVPDDGDGRYAHGVALSRTGEYARAVAELSAAAKLVPWSIDARTALAKTRYAWSRELMQRGRFAEAQAALRQATAEDPGSDQPRTLLASAYAMSGNFDLSEREIRHLLRKDPGDTVARRILASILYMRQEFDRAAVELERVVGEDPADFQAWATLASVRLKQGDHDGAVRAAEAGHKATPQEPSSLAALFHVLVEVERDEDAESLVQQTLEAEGEVALYRYLLATLRHRQKRYPDAVTEAALALDRSPAMSAALSLAVVCLADRMEDLPRALKFAQERSGRAPESLGMQHNVAFLLFRTGDRDGALKALRPILDSSTPFAYSIVLHAGILRDRGEYAAARESLVRGIEAYPSLPDFHYLMGETYLVEAHRVDDPAAAGTDRVPEPARGLAVAAFRRALELRTNHAMTRNNLAVLLSQEPGHLAEALAMIEGALEAAPTHPQFLDTRGSVLMQMNRPKLAVQTLRKALAILEEQRQALLDPKVRKGMTTEQFEKIERARSRLEASVQASFDEAVAAAEGKR